MASVENIDNHACLLLVCVVFVMGPGETGLFRCHFMNAVQVIRDFAEATEGLHDNYMCGKGISQIISPRWQMKTFKCPTSQVFPS